MTAQKERIILGCMTFGPDPAKGGQVTTIEATKEITDYFHSKGYNEIDTARVYHDGDNEGWMREVGWKEYGFEVATKLYPLTPGTHKPEVIRSSIATSLAELGTSQVDIWYLHAPDRSVPFEETLAEVDKLHKEGKFKILGLSNYTAFEVAEICTLCRERGWVRPRIYQAMYNAITRAIEKELIPACRRYGLDIVVYNPVAGGFFSGKYRSRSPPPPPPPPSSATSPSPSPTPTSRFFCANRGAAYRTRYFRDSYFEALDILEPVVLKHNITLLEASLRWLVHHSALKMRSEGGNDGIVIGVSRIEQLRENLTNLEKGPLPLEVVEALEKAWEVCRGVCPDYWHLKLEYTSQF